MDGTTRKTEAIDLLCPTCGARYAMPKYVEGQRYGCKRCSASLLFGKFALLKELGRGGFGVVYKAFQVDLERVVALKFLHSDSEESTERFVREARIAAQLNHPNIASIHDVGQHEGKLFITMQFIDGQLCHKLDLSAREAVQVIRDAALAVDYAHARDIVHRDLKPHNIMVAQERSGTASGEMSRRTYVMDFGLARSVGKDSSLTTEGQVLGTPAFMSPEQAEARPVDYRSDVYSLGATLYALVTRRPPFEAPTPVQVLMMVSKGDIRPPSQVNPQVDPGLEAIILKAMALRPEDRYPSAGRLAGDLALWLQGVTPDAGPTLHLSSTPVLKKGLPARKRRGLAVALLAALVVAGLGAAAAITLSRPGPASPHSSKGGAPPPADWVAIRVDTWPKGATVAVEGTDGSWTAPAEIRASQLRSSSPRVTASSPGYLPKSEIVTFTREKPAELRLVLQKPVAALLRVETDPPGATLRLTGRDGAWQTPCELSSAEIEPGEAEMVLSLAGHVTVKEKVTLAAGAPPLKRKLEKPVKTVALVVETEPRGARVLLNGLDSGETPLTVLREDVPGDEVRVVLELRGYVAVQRRVPLETLPQSVKVVLEPETGAIRVRGAAPSSTLLLFQIPKGVRSPRELLSLWSENPDALAEALEKIDPGDAAFAVERLREIAARGEPRLRTRAAALGASSPAAAAVRPERTAKADAEGKAFLEKIRVADRYRLLATSPSARDFLSEEIQPLNREETLVAIRATLLGTLSARLRPPVGSFQVTLPDGTSGGSLRPDGAAIRIPSGALTLKFVPPAGDSALWPFTLAVDLADRLELSDNVYLLAARKAEAAQVADLAVRGYTRALEEQNPPAAEEEARRQLPGKIRQLYRSWIDSAEQRGRAVAGDLASKVAAARGKVTPEAQAELLEVYTARNGAPPVRAAAAAALAQIHAGLKQPYEATEWLERAVREEADPGAEAERAVAAAIKGYPGLFPERWEPLTQSLARIRQAARRGPAFLGARGAEVPGRGVRVDQIAKGGPAEAAGVQFGDILVELGGAPLRTPADLDAAIRERADGEGIELKVDRGGERRSLAVRLGPVPANPAYAEAPPPAPAARVGIMALARDDLGFVIMLDENAQVSRGDVLEVVRNGQVVDELTVDKVGGKEARYPHGSAQCRKGKGQARRGDEVRRK
jgi:predicted Ser/Thr protein kinase